MSFVPERIESAKNSKVKLAVSLRQKKYRGRHGIYLVEGLRSVEMALQTKNHIAPVMCFFTAEILAADEKLISLLQQLSCPLYEVSETIFAKLSDTQSPQGIMLAVKKPQSELAFLPIGEHSCLLVLDRVQDPGNLGTIIRTADALGADAVACLKGTADIYSPKTVRSAMGSLFNLPIVTDLDEEKLIAFSRQKGLKLYATALDETAVKSWQADLCAKCAIIMGNEANGISENLLAAADAKIYIPMLGSAESFNVAVASSLILYERERKIFDIK